MPKIFISYSRKDIDLANYIADEFRKRGADVFIDYQNIQAGQNFPRRIADEIDTSDSLIFLLSKHSVISQWVIREIEYADQQKKLIIPVALDSTGLPPELFFLNRIDRVDLTGSTQGQSIEDGLRRLFRALSLPEGVIKFPTVPVVPPATQIALATEEDTKLPKGIDRKKFYRLLIGIVVAFVIMSILALIATIQNQQVPSVTPTTQIVVNPTDAQPPTEEPTLDIVFIVATLDAQGTAGVRATNIVSTTQAVIDATATATLWTNTPTPTATFTPNITASIDAFQTQRAATSTAQFALDQTATTTALIQLAENGVQSNADWQPYSQTFNGIQMMLVPAGCFDMGSEDGDLDEKPVEEFCFEKPFWIDRTEVTNQQYGSTGYFSGVNRPRENISWNDAKAFCESRGVRLPTEAEWEYAARGPNELKYPWGNDFVAENVIYSGNSNNQTAAVGGRLAGASWVGTLDMSGNVWEWVSSAYKHYPYVADDGREDSNTIGVLRVMLGGSYLVFPNYVRPANRHRDDPSFQGFSVGFRCAKDY